VGLIISITFSSCEDAAIVESDGATVNISVKDQYGNGIPDITVFKYSAANWSKFSDDRPFSGDSITTNKDGVATFNFDSASLIEPSNTYHFVCQCPISGPNITKSLGVTFGLGDDINRTIIIR
jgi:hypothetical protein